MRTKPTPRCVRWDHARARLPGPCAARRARTGRDPRRPVSAPRKPSARPSCLSRPNCTERPPGRASRNARGAEAQVGHTPGAVMGARPRPFGLRGFGYALRRRPRGGRGGRGSQEWATGRGDAARPAGSLCAEPRAGVPETTQPRPGALLPSRRRPRAAPSVTARRGPSYSRSHAAPTAQPRRGGPGAGSPEVVPP